MANSKIIFDGEVLIDLTSDTITSDKLLYGVTAHGADGEAITGSCDYDANTQSATAKIAEVLTGQTFYSKGTKLTGTMPNNGGTKIDISDLNSHSIPQGYNDGSGYAKISDTEKAKIVAGNIKSGVSILGITGTLTPSSDVTAQAKTVTPTASSQTILPDSGFDYISQVTVEGIPFTKALNSAGGYTVTIG